MIWNHKNDLKDLKSKVWLRGYSYFLLLWFLSNVYTPHKVQLPFCYKHLHLQILLIIGVSQNIHLLIKYLLEFQLTFVCLVLKRFIKSAEPEFWEIWFIHFFLPKKRTVLGTKVARFTTQWLLSNCLSFS